MTTFIEYLSKNSQDIILYDIKKFIKKENIKVTLKFTLVDLVSHCIMKENQELFDRLIKDIKDINECDTEHGSTLIMVAAERGRYNMLKVLLDKGASIKNDFINRKSALYYALNTKSNVYRSDFNANVQGRFKCAEELIKAGADIGFLEASDPSGYSIGKYIASVISRESGETKIDENKLVTLFPRTVAQVGYLVCDTKIFMIENNKDIEVMLKEGTNIEVPVYDKSFYHILPIGSNIYIKDNVKEITEPTFCYFENGATVNIDGEHLTLKDLYKSK